MDMNAIELGLFFLAHDLRTFPSNSRAEARLSTSIAPHNICPSPRDTIAQISLDSQPEIQTPRGCLGFRNARRGFTQMILEL